MNYPILALASYFQWAQIPLFEIALKTLNPEARVCNASSQALCLVGRPATTPEKSAKVLRIVVDSVTTLPVPISGVE
jgi:uncharacterized protein YfaQ (DUF2300 family)